MADLLELSARIIDSGVVDEPVNRISNELSEVAPAIAVVESFSHVVLLRTDDGLVAFDSSGVATGRDVVASLRGWTTEPVRSLVYTHGHVDHVGGSGAFVADAADRGHAKPTFVGHANVPHRIDRYRRTNGWNLLINRRQFGWLANPRMNIGAGPATELDPTATGSGGRQPKLDRFLPDDVAEPDITYHGSRTLDAALTGGTTIELHHARGETDDHTWAWLPDHKAICAGDFLIWNFPNAGNPQKVQRFPDEWAAALRDMVARGPELFLPAHGLPIGGAERIRAVLTDVADTLDTVVDQTLALMNDGADLDEVIHTVKVPAETLARPYLRPLYDEPEFVVRNIWRLYGGWWDADPAHLSPPPERSVAEEVATMAGGAGRLADRASEVADGGDLELACQLVEWAARAAPDDAAVHRIRAALYQRRRQAAPSLMAKGIYSSAIRASEQVAPPDTDA
ncbi:MAG TPA: alkyl sulfatase dimerization domain-containing protein [Acidimicrobiales bacterium]|jgi:alkyl sulfatase BDS1-like metallo-beta-lactamase superfamily hydrolase|nr:alkyl sulfatase dimerization domain-containing protein [Acidimicrobiales bacterium]